MFRHTGILFSHKVERNSDTCYTTNELQKHYVKGNKPDTKNATL